MGTESATNVELTKNAFESPCKNECFRNKVYKKKQTHVNEQGLTPTRKERSQRKEASNFNGLRVSFGSPIFYCNSNQMMHSDMRDDVKPLTVQAGEYVNEHMEYWLHKQDTETQQKKVALTNKNTNDKAVKRVIPAIHVSEEATIGIQLFNDMLIEVCAQGNIRVCHMNHMAATCAQGKVAIQHPNVQIDSQDGGHLFVNMSQGATVRTLSGVLKIRAHAKPLPTQSNDGHYDAKAFSTRKTNLYAKKYVPNLTETVWNLNAEKGLWEDKINEEEWWWPKRDVDLSEDMFRRSLEYQYNRQHERHKCLAIFNGIASYIVGHVLHVQVPLQHKYVQIQQDMKSGAVQVMDACVYRLVMQPEVHSIEVRTNTTRVLVQNWARVTVTQNDVQLHLDQGLDCMHAWHGPLVATFDLWGKAIPSNIQTILARLPPWVNCCSEDISMKK